MRTEQIHDQIIKQSRSHWEQYNLPGPLKNSILQQYHTEEHAEQTDTEATTDEFFIWYYYNHVNQQALDRILAGVHITGSITLPKHRLIHIGEVLERERIGQQDTVTLITRIQDNECTVVDIYLNEDTHVWYSQDCE